jgi:hypothetical protein
MHAVSRLLIAPLLLVSCAQAPTDSVVTSNVIGIDGHRASAIIKIRPFARTLMTQPLADVTGRISPDIAAALADDATRVTFSQLVACALPADVTLVATIDGQDLEFLGDHGLTPEWRNSSLSVSGQRWVSACMFAKVNARDVHLPVSLRGPNVGLALVEGEAEAFPLEEGAYFGNLFVPQDQPIQWYACRGRDQAAGDQGVLHIHDCSEPDLDKPSVTKCGLSYAGDCGNFSAQPACEAFLVNTTYYKRCHTAPSSSGGFEDAVFDEVVTLFLPD